MSKVGRDCADSDRAVEAGRALGASIVARYGGKTGSALALAMLDDDRAAEAGRALGARIVAQYGGKTGPALALAMLQ